MTFPRQFPHHLLALAIVLAKFLCSSCTHSRVHCNSHGNRIDNMNTIPLVDLGCCYSSASSIWDQVDGGGGWTAVVVVVVISDFPVGVPLTHIAQYRAHQLTFLIHCPYHFIYRRLIKPCPHDKLNPRRRRSWPTNECRNAVQVVQNNFTTISMLSSGMYICGI